MDSAAKLRVAGLISGMALGFVAAQIGLGILAPPIFAGCICLGVLAAEVTLPRPERAAPTTATLEVRRVRAYLPQPAARGVAIMGVVLALVLIVVMVVERFGSGWMPWSVSDRIRYFGTYGLISGFHRYAPFEFDQGVLLMSAVVTVAGSFALAIVVLRGLVLSPRSGVDEQQRSRDEAWRRRAAAMVTAAVGVILSLPLAALSLASAWALSDGGSRSLLGATMLATLGAAALVAFAGYTATMMRPASSWMAITHDGGSLPNELAGTSS